MHVQNHAYTNKSRCTYVCNLCQLSHPGFLIWFYEHDILCLQHNAKTTNISFFHISFNILRNNFFQKVPKAVTGGFP